MKGYAMLRIGATGWIEKERPVCGPLDAIVRPLALSRAPAMCTRYGKGPWATGTT